MGKSNHTETPGGTPVSKGIGSRKEQSCSLAPRSTVWEHRNVSLLFPAPRFVSGNYMGSHFHRESWDLEREAWEKVLWSCENGVCVPVAIHRAQGQKGFPEVDQHTQAYLTLFHTIIPRLSCLWNLEVSCLGHQETTFGFCLFKSKKTKLEALFSTHVFQGVSCFKETQVHCSMEFMT